MTRSVRIRGWWDDLRDSLWLIPSVAVVIAAVAAAVLTRVDPYLGWIPSALTFSGTPDGARAILAQLAGSTITVVGLVFSLTIIALQMAATQFSPRLLRTFLRDRRVQVVLSAMIASAVYSVGVLRTVRSAAENVVPFVPRTAVSVALLASFAAVGLLIYFIHYVAQHLRVDVVMREIVVATLAQLERVEADRDVLPDRIAPDPPADAVPVWARRGGYLQLVDASALADQAREAGLVVRLRPTLGEWVTEGTTIAWVWPDTATGDAVGDRDEVAVLIHRYLHLGVDRTESTDLAYGLRQMQDIATRALSPGVNDPTTAVLAIEQMSAVLCRYSRHPLGDSIVTDDDGAMRVAVPQPGFAALVELAVGGAVRYGARDADVLTALLTMLIDLAEHVADSSDRAAVVRRQVDRVGAAATCDDEIDVVRVERVRRLAEQALTQGTRSATVTAAK
ncbi:MAG: DUF2254 domain-containing protein [Nitriliruptoraceae bacterium]